MGMAPGKGMVFLINGKAFDSERIDTQVKLNAVEDWEVANVDPDMMDHPFHLHLTLPSLKAWGFSLLRESLESTELNPDTFPDLKTAQRAFLGIAHPYLELIRSQGFLKEGA